MDRDIAIVCSLHTQAPIVEVALRQCIDHVETAFYYNQSVSCSGGGFGLVDAVGLVVLGHFSLDGQLKKEHYTEKHHNMFIFDDKKSELMWKIIELLSFTGQTVLEIVTCTDDHHSVCTGTRAVTNGRNYIGIVENQEVVVAMQRETARIIDTESSDI